MRVRGGGVRAGGEVFVYVCLERLGGLKGEFDYVICRWEP